MPDIPAKTQFKSISIAFNFFFNLGNNKLLS
jgi:hypothetical protein